MTWREIQHKVLCYIHRKNSRKNKKNKKRECIFSSHAWGNMILVEPPKSPESNQSCRFKRRPMYLGTQDKKNVSARTGLALISVKYSCAPRNWIPISVLGSLAGKFLLSVGLKTALLVMLLHPIDLILAGSSKQ